MADALGLLKPAGAARRGLIPPAIAVVVVALDQASKAVVTAWLGPGSPERRWEVLGRFLAVEYVENTGAAFGVLRGQGALISVVAAVILVAVVAGFWRAATRSPWLSFGLGLVVGGAAGNLIDRALLGYVVDFVAVGTWPKFNAADAAITVGVLLLGWGATAASDRLPGANQSKAVPEDRTAYRGTLDEAVGPTGPRQPADTTSARAGREVPG